MYKFINILKYIKVGFLFILQNQLCQHMNEIESANSKMNIVCYMYVSSKQANNQSRDTA